MRPLIARLVQVGNRSAADTVLHIEYADSLDVDEEVRVVIA
jgi:hypothetical protein